MKSNFLRDGNAFRPVDPQSLNMHDRLPVGAYNVAVNPMTGYFFQKIEDFALPEKLYGDTTRNADRIFDTFLSRESGTGVILAGEKGSGKTMLSKKLAIKGAEADMPTIVINEDFHGDAFNRFIQGVSQPCVVLFDEFEKIYNRESQTKMLTMLDGTFSSKKLFVFTCNDKWRIDSYMRNRPGRIFYSIDFRGLDSGFVTEYCQDRLNNKDHIEGVCRIASMFAEFNFDMLKALVEEMNRYGETASEAMRLLNIRPESEEGVRFKVSVLRNGVQMGAPAEKVLGVNPLKLDESWGTYVRIAEESVEELRGSFRVDSDGDIHLTTGIALFESMNPESGDYIFKVRESEDCRIVFSRVISTFRSITY